jgi:hypothetical protein
MEPSVQKLAARAGFERGGSVRATTIQAIQDTLQKAGIVFIAANDGGPGARLRSSAQVLCASIPRFVSSV